MSAEENAYKQAIQCVTCEGCTLRQLPETFWQQSGCPPNEAADVLDTALGTYGSGYMSTWHEGDGEVALARQVADFSRNVLPIAEFEDEHRPGILVGGTAGELTFITDHQGEIDETPFSEMQPETRLVVSCLEKVLAGKCGTKQRMQDKPVTEVDIDLSALTTDYDFGANLLESYARNMPEADLWDVFKGLLPDIETVFATHAARSGQPFALPEFRHDSDPGIMRACLLKAAEHLRMVE